MKIENAFEVPLGVAETWELLLDVPHVISCMPGAQLLEVVDERTYRVQVKSRLGPVQMAFKGVAKMDEIDEARRRVRMKASGNETSGRGGAQAEITFSLSPKGEATVVNVLTELTMTGAVAQYGRGVGMISDVSRQLIAQFAETLRVQIQGSEAERAASLAKSQEAISALSIARAGISGAVRRWLGPEPPPERPTDPPPEPGKDEK